MADQSFQNKTPKSSAFVKWLLSISPSLTIPFPSLYLTTYSWVLPGYIQFPACAKLPHVLEPVTVAAVLAEIELTWADLNERTTSRGVGRVKWINKGRWSAHGLAMVGSYYHPGLRDRGRNSDVRAQGELEPSGGGAVYLFGSVPFGRCSYCQKVRMPSVSPSVPKLFCIMLITAFVTLLLQLIPLSGFHVSLHFPTWQRPSFLSYSKHI